RLDVDEEPGLAQLARESGDRRRGGSGGESVDLAAHVVHEIELAARVLAETDQAQVGVDELLVPDDPPPLVLQAPDFAGVVIAVDVGPDELLEPGAAVDVAAGDRTRL